MPETCFVCLQNCSRKVCFVCSCYAHPKCWQEYQSKLSSKKCPVCNTDNIVKPYNTRSKIFYLQETVDYMIKELGTQVDPHSFLIKKISTLISELHHLVPSSLVNNMNLKIEKIEKVMYWLLAGLKYDCSTNLLSYDKIFKVVSHKLNVFQRDGWPAASQWHKLLIGNDI